MDTLMKEGVISEAVLFATNYVKAMRADNITFDYTSYVSTASSKGIPKVGGTIFDVICMSSYPSLKPISTGDTGRIYMKEFGVVSAIFLRRYSIGQVWQVGDNLVFTCPFNIEISSYTYQSIFHKAFN